MNLKNHLDHVTYDQLILSSPDQKGGVFSLCLGQFKPRDYFGLDKISWSYVMFKMYSFKIDSVFIVSMCGWLVKVLAVPVQ